MLDGPYSRLGGVHNRLLPVCVRHDAQTALGSLIHDEPEFIPAEASGSHPAGLLEAHHSRCHDLYYTSAVAFKPFNLRPKFLPGFNGHTESRTVTAFLIQCPSSGNDAGGAFVVIDGSDTPRGIFSHACVTDSRNAGHGNYIERTNFFDMHMGVYETDAACLTTRIIAAFTIDV